MLQVARTAAAWASLCIMSNGLWECCPAPTILALGRPVVSLRNAKRDDCYLVQGLVYSSGRPQKHLDVLDGLDVVLLDDDDFDLGVAVVVPSIGAC